MSKSTSAWCRVILTTLLFFLAASMPLPAKADGGPIVGPNLWAFLKEGQQIAVVTLRDTETATVDLFISMLDGTGESHEVVFFVPLGVDASNFNVAERNSFGFDVLKTEDLDIILHNEATRKHEAIRSLFGATLLTNGVWLLPLWLPVILSGCAEPKPEATFETDSSRVSIYGLEADSDLDALIRTTGLDPAVRETLIRLQGQRIAVVTLQTEAQDTGEGGEVSPRRGEPGIHLSWTTSLTGGETGASYAYPLGTGAAWNHPIEMTRVYVVAPPGVDFSVEYPKLGAKKTGYAQKYGGSRQQIVDYYDVPAYAVDNAVGDFGRVWRAIYTQSNSAEDIIITAKPQSTLSRVYAGMQRGGSGPAALITGLILALAFWILGWRYLMPRLLGGRYGENIKELWRHAIVYTAVNLFVMIPGIFLYLFWSWTGNPLAFLGLVVLFGGASVLVFAGGRFRSLVDKETHVLKAFVLVTLASNGAYLICVLIYAALTGII